MKAPKSIQLPEIRNKLSPIKNLIAMLEDSPYKYHPVPEMHKLIVMEIQEVKKSIEYLSNPSNEIQLCERCRNQVFEPDQLIPTR
jgi:hypothetical protein